MSDRAVVNEYECPECQYKASWDKDFAPLCGLCAGDNGRDVRMFKVRAPEPQPRAVVAISEDRQWLVVPGPQKPEGWLVSVWSIYKRGEDGTYHPLFEPEDTDQSADEVLGEFLEERSKNV